MTCKNTFSQGRLKTSVISVICVMFSAENRKQASYVSYASWKNPTKSISMTGMTLMTGILVRLCVGSHKRHAMRHNHCEVTS
jgi:hypothetical protein